MRPLPFENTYARLPERFFELIRPTPVASPTLIFWNEELSQSLGLERRPGGDADLTAIFSGNRVPEGAEPLAQAYAGHQFGHFVPQLGDGRAILLGEVRAPSGQRFDVQLKGAGPTRYSRRGDGRAALGPMMRECILSEAMHALGIPTTRALALVSTGEPVQRESLLPGAVLTRVAASHVRVGSFQFLASREDIEGLRLLTDYTIDRHCPSARNAPNPALALLQYAVNSQADLVSRWLQVGFIHGVMNTDNMALSGETIDYGPCAFLDSFDPAAVFSSIDRNGRYAYREQPNIALWNLTRLAECLLPLFDPQVERATEIAKSALGDFAPSFERAHLAGLGRKLGFSSVGPTDIPLVEAWLALLTRSQADFTQVHAALGEAVASQGVAALKPFMPAEDALADWHAQWSARLHSEGTGNSEIQDRLRAANPLVIPRNHQVERAIRAAEDANDFVPFHELLRVVRQPYRLERPEDAAYQTPPRPEERVTATFCGT